MKETRRKPRSYSGFILEFFGRYLAHSPRFWAKILKLEPKLAVKSENPPDHRIQTIFLKFCRKEDWSFSSLPQQFQIIQIELTGASQELSKAIHATQDFAVMRYRSSSDPKYSKSSNFFRKVNYIIINIHPCSDKNKNKILGICSFTVSTAVERTRTATMSNRKRSSAL